MAPHLDFSLTGRLDSNRRPSPWQGDFRESGYLGFLVISQVRRCFRLSEGNHS
jgi:hypothetical protein